MTRTDEHNPTDGIPYALGSNCGMGGPIPFYDKYPPLPGQKPDVETNLEFMGKISS